MDMQFFFRIANEGTLDSEQTWYKHKETNWDSGLASVFLQHNIFFKLSTIFQTKNTPINKFSFASAIMSYSCINHILSVNEKYFPHISQWYPEISSYFPSKRKEKLFTLYMFSLNPVIILDLSSSAELLGHRFFKVYWWEMY